PAALPDNVSAAAYPKIEARGDLEKKIYYSKPVVEHPANGPLRVSVGVRSTRQDPIEAQFRFVFFNQTGRALTPAMDWRYIKLPARSQVFLQASALNKTAVDWRLQIRPFE